MRAIKETCNIKNCNKTLKQLKQVLSQSHGILHARFMKENQQYVYLNIPIIVRILIHIFSEGFLLLWELIWNLQRSTIGIAAICSFPLHDSAASLSDAFWLLGHSTSQFGLELCKYMLWWLAHMVFVDLLLQTLSISPVQEKRYRLLSRISLRNSNELEWAAQHG